MILGQLMPVANPDPEINLDNHEFKDHRLPCLLQSIIKQQGCMLDSQES